MQEAARTGMCFFLVCFSTAGASSSTSMTNFPCLLPAFDKLPLCQFGWLPLVLSFLGSLSEVWMVLSNNLLLMLECQPLPLPMALPSSHYFAHLLLCCRISRKGKSQLGAPRKRIKDIWYANSAWWSFFGCWLWWGSTIRLQRNWASSNVLLETESHDSLKTYKPIVV